MFAVGPSSFESAYTFAQYQSACGFSNTDQMSNILTSTFNAALTSTFNYFGNRIFQSTFPGSTLQFTGDPRSFQSTYSNFTIDYGPNAQFVSPYFPIGPTMSNLIVSKGYNVFVDFQYTLWLSTPYDTYTTINTTGFIGSNADCRGRSVQTRVGNTQFQTIRQELMFAPQSGNDFINNGQFGQVPDAFNFVIQFQSTANATSTKAPAFDVFIPGDNNVTMTFIPVTSPIV